MSHTPRRGTDLAAVAYRLSGLQEQLFERASVAIDATFGTATLVAIGRVLERMILTRLSRLQAVRDRFPFLRMTAFTGQVVTPRATAIVSPWPSKANTACRQLRRLDYPHR